MRVAPRTVLLLAPVAVAVAAVVLMPFNAGYYLTFVYDDPQGFDQQLEEYYTNGVYAYTSGFLVGQWLSFVVGSVLPARLGRALAMGGVLAAVNLAVTIPLAMVTIGRPLATAEQVRAEGMSFDPNLLNDSGVRWAIAVGLVAFPLFAAAGAGFGALVRRWWAVLVVSGVWWLLVVVPGFVVANTFPPPAVIPMAALLPPIGGYASVGLTAEAQYSPDYTNPLPPAWANAAFLGGLVVYAVVLNLIARRRGHNP